MTSAVVRIGPKGQIILKKEFRDLLGLSPGALIETTLRGNGLLLRPVNPLKELARVKKFREELGKHWPRNLDCVEAVREERR